MSTRVAFVGDATSVAGFRPLGFAVFPVEVADSARDLWAELSGGTYGVVFVTEPVYEAIADLVREVSDRPFPAVTVLPGAGSTGGVGQAKLDRAIERALGTKVPFTEEKEA
ncbi:MAG: V-type ATP synthase subunit F [Coriobacteriia bacterium]|nr:V-type ATP synthase subunit F [Coriobacteriia bacterium]